MTKVYGPRDLREAYMMPREDAVWIMEHCAEKWEAERKEFLRLGELACCCGVITAEDKADWDRIQQLLGGMAR